MKTKRALSELEGAVLGNLLKQGPSTAYRVRCAFLASPSSQWSGSAGAVYPALARLEKSGLVASKHAPRGGRDAWNYSLTAAGRASVVAWLEPPFSDAVISVAPDPVRTRVSILGALPRARRIRFLKQAIAELRRHLESLEPGAEWDDDDRRALRGAVLVTRARIEWLDELLRESGRNARG